LLAVAWLCYPLQSNLAGARALPVKHSTASIAVRRRRLTLKNLLRCLCLLLLVSIAWTTPYAQEGTEKKAAPEEKKQEDSAETVAILHTSMGDITLGFYPDAAPNHVDNFVELSRSKFYDGTLFHRVISGFMVQGGDPLSKDDNPGNDGTGNGPRRLKAEFGDLPHTRGAVSMARGGHPDSASCQFFIVHQDSNFLDGKYSVFAYVIEGMDVVDKIAAMPTNKSKGDRPLENVVIRSIEVTP
jgi:peptidyl-prolyl cis-trans isomerase B (cyclophilin B)